MENRSPQPNPTSTSLLLRLKTRDEAAWERFVAVYGPSVKSRIRRKLENFHLPIGHRDDIAQELFVTVHRYLPGFDRERIGSFRKWLHRLTDSRIADYCKKLNLNEINLTETEIDALHKIPDPISEIDDTDSEEDRTAEQRILLQSIVRMIKTDFRAETWRAFEGMVVDKLSAAQLAEELGMSEVAVRRAKGRVLRRINEEFGEMMD